MKELMKKAYDLIGDVDLDETEIRENVAAAVIALQKNNKDELVARAVAGAFFAKSIDVDISDVDEDSLGASRILGFSAGVLGALDLNIYFPIEWARFLGTGGDGLHGKTPSAETIYLTVSDDLETHLVKKFTLTEMVESLIDLHSCDDGTLTEDGAFAADLLAKALRDAANMLDAAKAVQS